MRLAAIVAGGIILTEGLVDALFAQHRLVNIRHLRARGGDFAVIGHHFIEPQLVQMLVALWRARHSPLLEMDLTRHRSAIARLLQCLG